MSYGKIYISGPMNGQPNHGIEAFKRARVYLNALGWNAQVPPFVDDQSLAQEIFDSGRDATPAEHASFLKQDLKVVLECEAIALINGWPRSRGAMIELNAAIGAGLDVYTLDLDAAPMVTTKWC